jgi:spore coat protein CotH
MSTTVLFSAGLSRRRVLSLSLAAVVGAATFNRLGRSVFASSVTTTETGLFFDPNVIHEIAISFDQDDYDAMIETFQESGDKDWIEATVTIDGSTYEQTGIRLKGNSSLGGLRMGPAEQEDELATPAADGGPGRRVVNGPGGDLSAASPETLPWLVRLDRSKDGQSHDGLTEFVIRSNNSKTALNEALALDLLAEAGLASQRAAYASLNVNGSDPVLRLSIENPRDAWMAAHFSADGLLFKSEAGGDWSYRGDAADAYNDIFDLEAGDTGDDDADFQPLAEWLDFLNNSDDDTFIAELPERLDVPRFANYLAMMDLIQNDDDIDGPGNNSYLYCAPETHQFTIVPWDMNLSFGNMGGGVMRVIDGQPVEGEGPPPSGTPGAMFITPGDDAATPASPGGMPQGDDSGPQFHTVDGGRGMENPLTRRFNGVDDFAKLVDEATTTLRTNLFDSGTASGILDRWVSVLQNGATALVDAETITSEADALRGVLTEE